MRLSSKFDVLRGWPREGAIDEAFYINQAVPGTDDLLPLGTVFYVNSSGKAQAASSPAALADAIGVWVVVAGNDDFSGQFVGKVVGLRGNAMLRLDPANLNAGTYTPGVPVTFSSGKWQPATVAGNQIIGEVVADNTAVDGTVVVMYTGGVGRKL